MANTEEHFWSRVTITKEGCWLWPASYCKVSGYGRFSVKGKRIKAHRYAFQVSRGPIPPGALVCHTCDTRLCVNPLHLFLGDDKSNAADRDQKKRGKIPMLSGERHPSAKLTREMVKKIRASKDLSTRARAEKFGVSAALISLIQSGKRWKNL